MKESGELESMLPKAKSLDDRLECPVSLTCHCCHVNCPFTNHPHRLKAIINQQKVMLFMKGSPEVRPHNIE